MTKKILLLVLFLPIICMLCLFTTTKTVSLAIDVPVSGIDIFEDDIVYLSLDQADKYKIEYTVYPTNASNQEVTLETAAIDDNRLAKFDFVDGYLVPKSIGMARVYLKTNDGGFKDSFIVKVDSTMVQELESEISASDIVIGQKAYIATKFIPANALDQLIGYTSSDPEVATVNSKGEVNGVGSGSATITIYSINRPEVFTTVTVNVFSAGDLDLPVNEVVSINKEGNVNLVISCETDYTLSYKVLDEALNPSNTNVAVTFGEEVNQKVSLSYKFDANFIGTINLEVTLTTKLGSITSKIIKIRIIDEIKLSFDQQSTTIDAGGKKFVGYTIDAGDVQISEPVVTSSNDNIVVNLFNDIVMLEGVKAGLSVITLQVYIVELNKTLTTTMEVLVYPKNFMINSKETKGIESVWAYGSGDDLSFEINLSHDKNVSKDFEDFIRWEAVDKLGNVIENLLTFTKTQEGKYIFKITNKEFNGEVYIRCVYSYGDYSLSTSNKALIRIVKDGINVYSYEELIEATEAEKIVVLQNSIIDDFGYINGSLTNYYYEIPTTYDWTFYKNLGHTEAPKIKVLVQIKNDLHGNGFTINAHNLVYKLDSTGNPTEDALFKNGPLNFVGLTETQGSAVSVKAQDNIVFAIYENVTINNVELKGCDLTKADNASSGTIDLTDLDYTGTTVEVLGDNVNIKYSRINHGRTVLRAFGDMNDSSKTININIKNSVLSIAREFIIRMGSNHFIDGKYNEDGTMNNSPSIPHNTNLKINKFPVADLYSKFTEVDREVYDDTFVKTFVNVENTVFENCGIFSIGIDSHFSGPALLDGSHKDITGLVGNWLVNWKNLAKTSYGAKLTFENDVRIFDWKEVDKVDSSTLIEIVGVDPNSNHIFNKLRFNIPKMVKLIKEKEGFESIIYEEKVIENGQEKTIEYVHGGIVFFGGGKNYGVFEDKNPYEALKAFPISLNDVGESHLNIAAGGEEFYFKLYDNKSLVSPQRQKELLSSGEGYSNIYK